VQILAQIRQLVHRPFGQFPMLLRLRSGGIL
jgi:hypothetical protein